MRLYKKIACILLAGVVLLTTPVFGYGETGDKNFSSQNAEVEAPSSEELGEAAKENLSQTEPNADGEISPDTEAAEDEDSEEGSEEELQPEVISSFEAPEPEISNQSMLVRGNASSLIFPESLQAVREDGETITVEGVTWTPDKPFSTLQADVFVYTPTLPESYQLVEGVELPKITVTVERRKTNVTGLVTSYKKSAKGTITDVITVYPADGRKVYLQFYDKGKWVTKRTYTTANKYKADIKIAYTKEWYQNPKSTWRIYMPQSPQGLAYSKKVTMTISRRYQPPTGYFQIKDSIPTRKSNYSLKVGMSGLKVNAVHKRLGISGKAYYSQRTKTAVMAFQKRHGLKITGVVNYATWKKMGYSKKNWNYLDSYVTPNKVPRNAGKSVYADTMVKTAQKYMGDPYVWCASGKVSQGVDCTGLVFQSLYSVGIDPLPLGSHVYAYNKNQYSSRKLAALSKFYKPSFGSRKRGDIIAYGFPVSHVAIYMGNDRIIEAAPGSGVRTNSVYAYRINCVLRPIV